MRDLWKNGNKTVNDMRVVKTSTKSFLYKTLEKCLQEGKKDEERDVPRGLPLETSPFFALRRIRPAATLKRISIRLVTEWQKPYMRTCI